MNRVRRAIVWATLTDCFVLMLLALFLLAVVGTAFGAEPASYRGAIDSATRDGKPLVVVAGEPARAFPGCVVYRAQPADQFPRGVWLCDPCTRSMRRVADAPKPAERPTMDATPAFPLLYGGFGAGCSGGR